MQLKLLRLSTTKDSTVGVLYRDGIFECFTCEDPWHKMKIPGETRIPAGTYDIQLRTEGGMIERYKKKFGESHRGMLWLQNVPGYQYVYLHIGNSASDTEGCILVGSTAHADKHIGYIRDSVSAYLVLYEHIYEALNAGEKVTIQILDHLP